MKGPLPCMRCFRLFTISRGQLPFNHEGENDRRAELTKDEDSVVHQLSKCLINSPRDELLSVTNRFYNPRRLQTNGKDILKTPKNRCIGQLTLVMLFLHQQPKPMFRVRFSSVQELPSKFFFFLFQVGYCSIIWKLWLIICPWTHLQNYQQVL